MESIQLVIPKGYDLTCKRKNGLLVGSVAAITNDVTVTIDNIADLYYIVQYGSSNASGAYMQINCEVYELHKFDTKKEEDNNGR